jgi:hypothetical protein
MMSMSEIEFYRTCYDILYSLDEADEDKIIEAALSRGINEEDIARVVSFVLSRLPWIVVED